MGERAGQLYALALAVRLVQPRADIWNAPKMTITFRDTKNTAPMTWSDPSVIESQRCSTQVASWDRLENYNRGHGEILND